MRAQFEKMPEIATSLSQHIYFGDDNLYHSDLINFQKLVCWINGAWYAWQAAKAESHKQAALYQFEINHLAQANEQWREQAAKAQAVSEGRTDFEIINQTIELVDLLALSTNIFQRDPKSKVHPFESENPRVMEWWRTACQIQELLTNTDPDNCDFEEYKAMIEAQESKG